MADCAVKFQPPAPFKITAQTKLDDWRRWQKSYKWYASEVNLTQQSHDVQLSAFKSLIGPEALEIYNTFSLLDIGDVESVIQKFDEHFKPKVNLVIERLKLYRLFQKTGQNFETFLAAVSLQVDKCEFGSMRDDIILYKIVGGLADDDVRKALLTDPNLNCDKAIQICRASAASRFMSGKVDLGKNADQKKKEEPPKTPRIALKKLSGLLKNDKEEEITSKMSTRTSKVAQKKTTACEKSRKSSSPAKKTAKAVQKMKAAHIVNSQELMNDSEEDVEVVSPSKKLAKLAQKPTKRKKDKKPAVAAKKSPKADKKQADNEEDHERRSATKKPLKAAEKRSNGDEMKVSSIDEEPLEVNREAEGAKGREPDPAGSGGRNEDVSSDDGGDDWRDADYHVEDDDDDADDDELGRAASNVKKNLDSKKDRDGDETGYPGATIYHYYYKRTDQTDKFSCDVCDAVFHVKQLLTTHRMTHATEETCEPGEKTEKKVGYPCEVCGKVLTSKSGRFVHRMNHVKGQFFSCYYCGVRTKFKQRMYLRRHIFKMHSDILGNKPKYFTCDECGYQTVVSSNMKRHKYKHSVEKPISCELCDYRCIVAHQMKMHMTTKHLEGEQNPVSCSQCPMKFKNPNALKPHMLSHMSPEEREQHRSELMKDSVYTHPCDYCGKVFTSKTGLRSHIYSHTGEKPFACKQCDYKAVQQSSLTTHIKLKHSAEKPFICSVCGYACKLKTTLTTHMTVHTGERSYACDICEKKFKQHSHLITHKKTHTGEKPFVCDICGHRWAQEGNLRAHMKIHRNQSGDPTQYSPPRKRKKKPKTDQPAPEPPPAPAPPSAIPPWSEQVATINPMECFPNLETPPPFHPTYLVHQGNPRPPGADCRYFQQRQWPNQNQNQNQVQNPNQHLISIRPVALIRADMQHPQV